MEHKRYKLVVDNNAFIVVENPNSFGNGRCYEVVNSTEEIFEMIEDEKIEKSFVDHNPKFKSGDIGFETMMIDWRKAYKSNPAKWTDEELKKAYNAGYQNGWDGHGSDFDFHFDLYKFQSIPKEMFVELDMEDVDYRFGGEEYRSKPKLYPNNAVRITKIIL